MAIHHHTKSCPKHPNCRTVVPIETMAQWHHFPTDELSAALVDTCHLVRGGIGEFAVCTQCAKDFNRIIGLATTDFSHA